MPAAIDEQRIFDAALRVVTERGYVGATTKLIAEEAGIGEVTLFRRFGDKETLLLEAMKWEAAKLDREVSFYTGDAEADLVRITSAYQQLVHARAPFLLTYFNEARRHPELAAVFEHPLRQMRAIVEVVRRYQQEGRLKPIDPVRQIAALFGPIVMAAMFEIVGLTAGPLSVEEHVRLFLDGQGMAVD